MSAKRTCSSHDAHPDGRPRERQATVTKVCNSRLRMVRAAAGSEPPSTTEPKGHTMSESQPAGQISPDGNYVWDGNAWQPRTQGQPYPGGMQMQQPKQNHTLRNVLLALTVVFVLFVGGCMAIVGLAANEVSKEIDKSAAADKEPGGPDNPLTIVEGEAFEVSGFEYQAGWSLGNDALGDLDIQGLKFKNQRDDADTAIVEIRIVKGAELVASADCISDEAEVGQIVTLTCLSADKLPTDYDKITINDSF